MKITADNKTRYLDDQTLNALQDTIRVWKLVDSYVISLPFSDHLLYKLK